MPRSKRKGWNTDKAVGEPDGDWEMPAVLPVVACVETAILQTPMRPR